MTQLVLLHYIVLVLLYYILSFHIYIYIYIKPNQNKENKKKATKTLSQMIGKLLTIQQTFLMHVKTILLILDIPCQKICRKLASTLRISYK